MFYCNIYSNIQIKQLYFFLNHQYPLDANIRDAPIKERLLKIWVISAHALLELKPLMLVIYVIVATRIITPVAANFDARLNQKENAAIIQHIPVKITQNLASGNPCNIYCASALLYTNPDNAICWTAMWASQEY